MAILLTLFTILKLCFVIQGGDARRGVDPVTSSPGRDLPPFEDEEVQLLLYMICAKVEDFS